MVDLAAAEAELAWHEGNPKEIDRVTAPVLAAAARRGAAEDAARLVVLAPTCRSSGRDRRLLGTLCGRGRRATGDEAAAQWTRHGCPYETALALSEADDEEALVRALADLPRARRTSPRSEGRPRSSRARRERRSAWPQTIHAREPCRTHHARARSAPAGGRGASQRRDRRAPRRLEANRRPSRLGDPSQARRTHARRGRRRGDAARRARR